MIFFEDSDRIFENENPLLGLGGEVIQILGQNETALPLGGRTTSHD